MKTPAPAPSRQRRARMVAPQRSLRRAISTLASALLPIALGACLSQAPAGEYGDPTELDAATTQGGITARVIAPRVATLHAEPTVDVELAAFTDPPVALDVSFEDDLGGVVEATATGAPGEDQRFHASLPLLHGQNRFIVRIFEANGFRSRRLEIAARYAGEAPGLGFAFFQAEDPSGCDAPLSAGITGADEVCVRGRISLEADAAGETTVTLSGAEGEVSATTDEAGAFEARVPLALDRAQMIEARVAVGTRTTTLSATVRQDATPPEITAALAEISPSRTDASRVDVTGTASDAFGLASIEIVNGGGGVVEVVPSAEWSREVRLEPGENAFTIRAGDLAGNVRELGFVLIRDRLIRLRTPGDAGGAVLDLDRDALGEVLTEQTQRDTRVATISLRTPVVQALYRIRDPERHEVDTSAWGPGEWNLHDLLNMTPDTADLSGSSLEALLNIAPSVGLPAPRVLAELVDIEPTDTFIDIERVADVVLDQLIGTHGHIALDADTGDPALDLSMFDVLNDLAPIAARFGPLDAHPGFLTGESFANVFEPGFAMRIPARSNLRPYEGVDAARANKSYLFRLEGEESLVLDFLSPEFSVVGLVDEPVVDLAFAMGEDPAFLGVATTQGANPDPSRPGFARGDGGAFGAAPWHLEHIVAEAAYRQVHALYEDTAFARTLRYDAGSIVDAAVLTWARGWLGITTSGGLGDPPPPTYFWDVLSEVAQLRLHDGGIPEGEADLNFLLEGIPVGLDAEGLIEVLRPSLQAESEALAASLVSPDGLVESRADFYFVPSNDGGDGGDGGPGFLFFRAPEDASGSYDYATPGFFRDASLSDRASTSGPLPGTDDDAHEKIEVAEGATYYLADEDDHRYALEIVTVDTDGVALRIIPQPVGAL